MDSFLGVGLNRLVLQVFTNNQKILMNEKFQTGHVGWSPDYKTDKYRNHLRAAEEMTEAHKEWMKCLEVLLEYYPEMGERTEPLSDQLREILQQNT